jgi:hypothetical protein
MAHRQQRLTLKAEQRQPIEDPVPECFLSRYLPQVTTGAPFSVTIKARMAMQ